MKNNKFIRFYPGQLVVCNNGQWYNASSTGLDAVPTGPKMGMEYTVNLATWVRLLDKWKLAYCIELKEFPGILYTATCFEPAMPLKSINSLENSLSTALLITKSQRN